MTILNMIDKKIESSRLGPIDKGWVQFIKDHVSYIKETSIEHTISEDYFRKYKYNPNRYLKSISTNDDLCWIVKYINNIISEIDFINIRTILIPNTDVIKKLYKTYKTIQSKENKIKN